MAEYIDRQLCETAADYDEHYRLIVPLSKIRKFPSADVEPVVHGEWLPDMEEFDDDPSVGLKGGLFQTGWKCSVCGRREQLTEPYCNCGAKMDGGADGGAG